VTRALRVSRAALGWGTQRSSTSRASTPSPARCFRSPLSPRPAHPLCPYLRCRGPRSAALQTRPNAAVAAAAAGAQGHQGGHVRAGAAVRLSRPSRFSRLRRHSRPSHFSRPSVAAVRVVLVVRAAVHESSESSEAAGPFGRRQPCSSGHCGVGPGMPSLPNVRIVRYDRWKQIDDEKDGQTMILACV
jgi:hypothetical protein